MKVLVDGAAGYIGSTLCPLLLERGYEVIALDNLYKGHADALIPCASYSGFNFIRGDIRDERLVEDLMHKVDGIIHLAGLVGFPACHKDPWLSKSVNVDGTANILKHRQYDIPLVYSSTGSNYGKVEGICTEDTPCNPVSEYGVDKYAAEKLVEAENNTVSLRFATAYGVSPCLRVNLLINDLVYQAIKNGGFKIFQSDFKRTFIHVKDMAHGLIFAMEGLLDHKLQHKVYNCGGESGNCSKRDVAEYIKNKTGCKVEYGIDGHDPDLRDYIVDYSRIRAAGFNLTYNMDQGLNELIRVTPLLQNQERYA